MNKKITTVQLFVTCLVDKFYPEAGFATVEILENLGLTVEFPQAQTCCGQPAYNGGFWDDARAMARHTVNVLAQSDAPIVVPSGSCAEMIVHHYPDLLADDPAATAAANVAARTYELTQFLVDVLGITNLHTAHPGTAAYHASCHGLRGLGLSHQPRQLLQNVDGLNLTDLPEAETCCGFGGLFAIKMSDISGAMLTAKLDNIETSGAEIITATDVSCLMHMAGGLHRRGSRVQVKHIAEILSGSHKESTQ
jgi:L-lactate dehydrogenase complex protein LldE